MLILNNKNKMLILNNKNIDCNECGLQWTACNPKKVIEKCDLNSLVRFVEINTDAYDPVGLWCLLNMNHCLSGSKRCNIFQVIL